MRLLVLAVALFVVGSICAQTTEQREDACSFAHPPAWPSFHFHALDKDAILLVRSGITPPPKGVTVLGWLGTSMPDRPLRVWVYTRPNEPGTHSYNLHGDGLARLYGEVEKWLKEREPPEKPLFVQK